MERVELTKIKYANSEDTGETPLNSDFGIDNKR
jgi:hypothetical protein